MTDLPLLSRVALLSPRRVQASLDALAASGRTDLPNPWQLTLGVIRMWGRLLFRSDTVGTSPGGTVRAGWRARALTWRALRLPFLLAERAVHPLDFTGLASSRERVIRHLLGAHHDGAQFLYDLEILAAHPGALDELRERAAAVVADATPRSRWLRDLVVFDGYHEALLAAVDAARAGDFPYDPDGARDPDVSFSAYLAWCAAQPATPAATLAAWRRGDLDLGPTRIDPAARPAAWLAARPAPARAAAATATAT
ncbi:MAG: hypothetical protein H6709_24555 [Kofleriaceae bacterium]|nr:hypothetical protein [Kofleriaceae bacterium]